MRIGIGSSAGDRFVEVDALVDTGATYTWIPGEILERLHVAATEERAFVLADGQQVSYPIAWVQARIEGRAQPTIAVVGEPGSEALLGVFTLEGFGLAADPVNRRLVPVPALLKEADQRLVRSRRGHRRGAAQGAALGSEAEPARPLDGNFECPERARSRPHPSVECDQDAGALIGGDREV